jgi:tetratricopeptide (TPR) repeat protein
VAQSDDPYSDILFMVIDGEFEKAIHKAEKFTNRDKTRKEAEPYILMSMAYYEISKDESMREDYPRAFRDATKNAYKGVRYDDEGIVADKHASYLTELKVDLMREARFYYDSGTWRKSLTNAKYVTRIDPDHIAALLIKGAAEMRSRNAYQAKTTFEEAHKAAENAAVSDYSSEELPFLRFAILEYATIMKETGEKEKAKPMLELGETTFEDDREFQNFISAF